MKITKKILLIVAALTICISSNSQSQGSAGKVKSVVVYQEKYDALVTRKYKELEQNFDSKGNLIEEINYKQGRIVKHFKYQYDSDNNKVKEEEYDPSGRLIEISEYKFTNGIRTEKAVYDSSRKLRSKKTYIYTTY